MALPVIPLVVGAGLVLALVMGTKASSAASAAPQLPGGPDTAPPGGGIPGAPSTPDQGSGGGDSASAPAPGAAPTVGIPDSKGGMTSVTSAPVGALPPGTQATTGSTGVVHADDAFDAAVAAAIAAKDIAALEKLAAQADAQGLHSVADSIRQEIARLKGTAPPPVTPKPDEPHVAQGLATYIVKSGDTGTKIAKAYTGDGNRWRELLTVNPTLKDPKYGIRLYAGQRINLPASWPTGAPVIPPTASPAIQPSPASPTTQPVPPAVPAGTHTYTVVSGDTGEKVAAKFTGDKNRWRELLAVNPSLKSAKYGIALYAGHSISIPASWPAAPMGAAAPVASSQTAPTAPPPVASSAPPQSDVMAAAVQLTSYLQSIGGLSGRGKESRPTVSNYLSRLGVPDPTGMYGRQGATAVMQAGLVPVVPYYWPKTGATQAKQDFTRLVQNYQASDPQRTAQWDALIRDIQRA